MSFPSVDDFVSISSVLPMSLPHVHMLLCLMLLGAHQVLVLQGLRKKHLCHDFVRFVSLFDSRGRPDANEVTEASIR